MNITVRKWGNSAAVRIPASIMEDLKLDLDAVVDVRAERGRIIIEPVRQRKYDINALVDGITADNLHSAEDTGPAVGREAW